ncbi:MAG: hypothetical protein IMF15_05145 [Proteobacteria bacterium]|nr:hypothetical protein [Pseudomonadota bacterium]
MAFFTHRNSKKYLHVLALVTIVIGLHACGFQLRGSINLSAEISPMYIEQNNMFDLAREIRSLLATNKIEVVEDAKLSKAQLTLVNEEKTRRVLSVDGSGRAREYLLQYKVNFMVKTAIEDPEIKVKGGPDSISPDSISVARSLLFDPDAVLAITNEAEILYKDMQRDAARLILLKLQARSTADTNSSGGKDKLVSDPGLDSAATK